MLYIHILLGQVLGTNISLALELFGRRDKLISSIIMVSGEIVLVQYHTKVLDIVKEQVILVLICVNTANLKGG